MHHARSSGIDFGALRSGGATLSFEVPALHPECAWVGFATIRAIRALKISRRGAFTESSPARERGLWTRIPRMGANAMPTHQHWGGAPPLATQPKKKIRTLHENRRVQDGCELGRACTEGQEASFSHTERSAGCWSSPKVDSTVPGASSPKSIPLDPARAVPSRFHSTRRTRTDFVSLYFRDAKRLNRRPSTSSTTAPSVAMPMERKSRLP
jgi:hypothetical protein